MTGGLSNDDIGALLGCGGRTVGKHVERILHKLGGLATRASVAALAIEQDLLVLPLPGSGRALRGLAAGRVQALARGGRPRPAPAGRPRRRLRYLIGSAYPRRGPVAADGDEMVAGSALAIAETNRRGGIAGRPVEQLVVDVDPLEPASVMGAIESLVDQEVDAITAGWMLPEREAVDAAAPYGCPLLSAFTSEYVAELVREQQCAYGSIFQVCATEAVYGRGFIRWLDGLEASRAWRPASRRLVFIEPRVQSSHMANEPALQAAERSGWQVEVESTPARMASWEPVLDIIRRRDPAALLLAQWLPGEAASFQRAFAADPTDALVYVVYSPSIPAYVERAGAAAEGVLWSTVTGSYGDDIGRAFAQRFQQAFGRAPGRSHAGIAYDEVHLLADAWARVGNPRRFRRRRPRAVAGALPRRQRRLLPERRVALRAVVSRHHPRPLAGPGPPGASDPGRPEPGAGAVAVRRVELPDALVDDDGDAGRACDLTGAPRDAVCTPFPLVWTPTRCSS